MGLPEKPKKPRCKKFDKGYGQTRKSRDQEERIAKKIGGRRQPGSGNQGFRKGDVGTATGTTSHGDSFRPGDITHDSFLLEAKRTDAKSIRIEGEWLTKIEAEAAHMGKHPALVFEIGGRISLGEKDWVAVPASIFDALFKDGGNKDGICQCGKCNNG